MAEVAAQIKIMPNGPNVDLEDLSTRIESRVAQYGRIHSCEVEPIAFGLKALKILIVVPDKELGDIEEKIRKVKGVSEVEAGSATLL